ncbi:putative porin [Parashewanella spongiae]|uniref:Putative porin n=1 Tax=Parashewanella spongiae TaxID=342950 RepID=A0A3A6TZU6_9GAMM|nr:putative porin [Parashewanella spongiae]MCL1079597.1 porin family protein [Parashewanella spongiae]RJY07340.1 putative porin [Parashewanella spongiae]
MKLRISYLALCIGMINGAAYAAEGRSSYQHEAKLVYSSNSDNSDSSYWKGAYRYYLDNVEKSNRPYNLTGFLSRTSNFGVNYIEADKKKNDNLVLDGQYFLDSQWYISGSYDRSESNKYDNEQDSYGVSVGYFFTETAAIYVNYEHSEDDLTKKDLTSRKVTEGDTYGIGVESYTAFETTSGLYLKAGIGRSSWDTKQTSATTQTSSSGDLTYYSADADWYLMDTLSIGLGYSRQDGDDRDEEAFEGNASYVLKLTDSITAKFNVNKLFKPDIDGVYYSVGLSGRF